MAQRIDPPGDPAGGGRRRHRDTEGSPEAEMAARREINLAEKERRQNLERGREAEQLSNELLQAFSASRTLSHDDLKKLDRVEKLARTVRRVEGGSEGDEKPDKIPTQLEAGLKQMVEVTTDLRKRIENTPRQVVSATIISETNVLLELVKYVRALSQ